MAESRVWVYLLQQKMNQQQARLMGVDVHILPWRKQVCVTIVQIRSGGLDGAGICSGSKLNADNP